MSGEVRIEREGRIGWLVFDHQQRHNAMTGDMWRSVPRLCDELSTDGAVRVVCLRGGGERAFVVGADISEFQSDRSGPNSPSYDRMTGAAFGAIAAIPKPVVAMIHGFCIGGGLAIAAAADLRYVADDAQFGVPPARLGIGYDASGIGTLVDLLGPSVTKELVFTADWFDAETALRWGLANAVVDKTSLDAFVTKQLNTVASRSPLSQLAAKLAVADHLRPLAERRQGEVDEAIARCFSSDDYVEGLNAFMEKRAPQFRGQ